MKDIKTLNDYLILEEKEQAVRRTESGLDLTIDQLGDIRYLEGEIVAQNASIDVIKKGDRVLYDKVAGHYINLEDKQYKVIRLRDIVIVL